MEPTIFPFYITLSQREFSVNCRLFRDDCHQLLAL